MSDPSSPVGYNPLRRVTAAKIPLAASGIMECFRKLWREAWGVRMEHILRNALFALIETPGSTFPDILRLLFDEEFRAGVTERLTNEQVRRFWLDEFPRYSGSYRSDGAGPNSEQGGSLSGRSDALQNPDQAAD